SLRKLVRSTQSTSSLRRQGSMSRRLPRCRFGWHDVGWEATGCSDTGTRAAHIHARLVGTAFGAQARPRSPQRDDLRGGYLAGAGLHAPVGEVAHLAAVAQLAKARQVDR